MNFKKTWLLLNEFWANQGCTIVTSYDKSMGAATLHPITFFRALSPQKTYISYIQTCRRPDDIRLGHTGDRLGTFHQYQVIIKPVPTNFIELYYQSLAYLSLNNDNHDLFLVEDNWKSPGIGSYGVGWESRCDNWEIAQLTNFNKIGLIKCQETMLEFAYGLERISLLRQSDSEQRSITLKELKYDDQYLYQDIYPLEFTNNHQLIKTSLEDLTKLVVNCEANIAINNYWASYDYLIEANHTLNLLKYLGIMNHSLIAYWLKELGNLSFKIANIYVKEHEKTI